MSKPSFRMPQRAASAGGEIDKWVVSGEGTTAVPEPGAHHDRVVGKPARLTIDLPAELHARFKATCALRGTRMIDEVRKFIEAWTQKNG